MSPSTFRSGYVSIVGWPNVGKSSLLNALLGLKLAIVTPKPQTTRDAVLGILNSSDSQMVFVDTPGWLKPSDTFQSFMKRSIVRAIYDDADVVLWLLEPRAPSAEDLEFGAMLKKTRKPLVVLLNKIDTVSKEDAARITAQVKEQLALESDVFLVSATTGQGLPELKSRLAELLPESPPYFPEGQVTDRWERYYVAELIREQLFHLFHQEVPHATFVSIEDFVEKPQRKDVIRAVLITESENQKKILVGKNGQAIKSLGQMARGEIEKQLGRPVFLELTVKVRPGWRNDPAFLKSARDGKEWEKKNHS